MTTATIDVEREALRTREARIARANERYWRDNLRVMTVLLVIWALASFGCAILFADWLNRFTVPFTGFPLGFWFAHQGAIVVFVLCILIYCIVMNRLDRRHHDELIAIDAGSSAP